MAAEKRCLYEVLGLSLDCSQDEIRSAYKKLALQRHPDKLVQSGVSQEEATAQFQELVHAYEVLSDPKERSWYDSHRSQILFADRNDTSNSPIPDLFSFFSNTIYSGYSDKGRGFYKVYSELFSKIYANEINFARKLGLRLDIVKEAPLMGNLESPYTQVTAFYNYWLGFSTVMDFVWVDEYDVMAGPNRKSRRVMEEENKKLRKKAKREYNETVRGLAEFVKKRDKRVIDMGVKRKEEMERKKEEERERKKKLEKERLERIKAYEGPEWVKVDVEDLDDWDEMEEKGIDKEEFYCVACSKKFKSEKQWKNHEQSKKHKEKVAELRESFIGEEEEEGDLEVEPDMEERFRESLKVEEEGEEEGENGVGNLSEEDDRFFDVNQGGEEGVEIDSDNDHAEEISVLEAMLSRRKDKKNVSFNSEGMVSQTGLHVKDETDEEEYMEYGRRKNRRRNRTGKKDKGKKNSSDAMKSDINEAESKNEEANVSDSLHVDKQPVEDESSNGEKDDKLGNNANISKQPLDRKGNTKKELNTKSNKSSKGKKAKATAKHSGNVCETCGEEFQSKNKLHKHLGDSGHASLKF
ncbi:LOW QUALITY PROTEIN: DNAJ protein JJJ1 homolog [Hibiscus syriacus]|uniref:LOW QUALITY PROTEIN: DNAJ protein JJJ1 homolog n=1 Tax=Hibiscus syriacus TaxID=106335 RepID=UPI001922C857|nr:LOW QUALITY PROTEIN: DNAJ protein JJJ1 homolog [Hibiscus syriacus]